MMLTRNKKDAFRQYKHTNELDIYNSFIQYRMGNHMFFVLIQCREK